MKTGKRVLILLFFALTLYFIARSNVGQSPLRGALPLPEWLMKTPQPVVCVGPTQDSCGILQGLWHLHDRRFMTIGFKEYMPFIVLYRDMYSCKIIRRHRGFAQLEFVELECPNLSHGVTTRIPPLQASFQSFSWLASVFKNNTWTWVPARPVTWMPVNGQFVPLFKFRSRPIVGSYLRSVDGKYRLGPIVELPGTNMWVPLEPTGKNVLGMYRVPLAPSLHRPPSRLLLLSHP